MGVCANGQSNRGGVFVFKGAHVILEDAGKFYGMWARHIPANQINLGRISSHYGGGKSKGGKVAQYELVFPKGWGGLLFGLVEVQGNGGWNVGMPLNTWFQSEGAPLEDFWGHVKTTAQYGWTIAKGNPQNIG